ncbi:unnamed protein product [Toxocara canis]|uniref:Uncharacterized protein n=1 Tax=Toxocara canis TaxID=6265 RepID=A0A183V881_TOXCA|nr:unnamed protein product [Toxocara canis]
MDLSLFSLAHATNIHDAIPSTKAQFEQLLSTSMIALRDICQAYPQPTDPDRLSDALSIHTTTNRTLFEIFYMEQLSSQPTVTPLNREHTGPVESTNATTSQLECADGHDASASDRYDVRPTMPTVSLLTCSTSKRRGVVYVCTLPVICSLSVLCHLFVFHNCFIIAISGPTICIAQCFIITRQAQLR